MENQSNSNSVAVKQERTSTSTDGPSPSPAMLPLKRYDLYVEDDLCFYMLDVSGELTLHLDVQGKINKDRINHIQNILDHLVIEFIDRGMTHVDTWIPENDDQKIRFAEHFGFEATGYNKIVRAVIGAGTQDFQLMELRLKFPTEAE